MRSNLHELDDLVRLAADVGVDRLWLQALSHDFSDTGDGDEAYVEIRSFAERESVWSGDGDAAGGDVRAAMGRARTLAGRLGVALRLPEDGPPDELAAGEGTDLPCDWPWTSTYVTHDGKVQPCCMVMGDDRVVLGHIDDDGGLAGVWHGKAYRRFRRELASDRPPAVCRGCSLYRHVF
jgi:radical SAM protein with 4Fe4S-binding SPASM domain